MSRKNRSARFKQGRLRPQIRPHRRHSRIDLTDRAFWTPQVPLTYCPGPHEVLDLDAQIACLGPMDRARRAQPRMGPLIGSIFAWFGGLTLTAQIFVGAIAILGLAYVSRLLQRPSVDLGDFPRTYAWNARRNTLGIGLPVPILYGEDQYFPHIIQQYIDADAADTEILYTLYAVSEGRIESMADIELNEQPIEEYTGVSWMARLGDAVQAAIPWFQDTRNTYAVDVQLNTDSRSFIYRTLTSIDRFIVKVKFAAFQGAASVGTSSSTVTVRVEHRRVGDTSWISLGDTGIAVNTRREVTRALPSGDLGLARLSTSSAVANNASIGGTVWTNPTNAQGAGNDQWAEVVELSVTPRDTQYLAATGFGLAVPGDATITGIQFEVERHHAPGGSSGGGDWDPLPLSTYDRSVRIIQGGSIVGTEFADTVTAWPTTDTARVYGGATELWGTTWTPAQVNASTFGLAFAARVDQGTCRVDAFTVRVFYTSPTTPTRSQREIRVTRVSTSSSDRPPMLFHSVDEFIYGSVANTYPNVAVLGTRIQAGDQLSGESPRTSALVRGRRVRPITSATTIGATEVWSQNPVECLLDLLTNSRYGLGAYIATSIINVSSFYTARQYCNDFVGGEARHQVDLVLDEQRAAWDWVDFLLNTFRGFLVESDGTYRLGVDHITPPSQLFSDANIARGSLKTSWVSLSEEFDQVEMIYYDRANAYRRDSVLIPAIGSGLKRKSIDGRGITRRTHATREATYHYNVITRLSRFVEFDCAIEALAVDVGDVIYVSHSVPQWGQAGRVVAVVNSAGNHVVTVDRGDLPTAGLTGYTLLIRQTNDTLEERTVTAISAPFTSAEGYPRQDVTVSGLFAATPTARDALWVLGSP